MQKSEHKDINYYFLRQFIHPKTPVGYRENIVILFINKSSTSHKDQYLLVKEKNNAWSMPKTGIKGDNAIDGIVNAFTQNIGKELGFEGVVVQLAKPEFIQRAYLINFATQKYDPVRSAYEQEKGRPSKGKIYHLAVVEYYGSEELPMKKNLERAFVQDTKWVDYEEGIKLLESNSELLKADTKRYSKGSIGFNLHLFERSYKALNLVQEAFQDGTDDTQLKLLS